MRNIFVAMLGLLGLLVPGRVLAQPVPCTATLPEIPYQFQAVDVGTGMVVSTLCLGRTVRLEPVASRGSIVPTLLYYNANPGVSVLPAPCNFNPGRLANNQFTPTAAGPVTLSENYVGSGGATGTVFFHNYTVNASPKPTFTVAPCVGGQVLVTVTDVVYNNYTVRVNNGMPRSVLRGANVGIIASAGSTLTLIGRYASADPCEGRDSVVVRALAAPVRPVITRLTLGVPLPTSPASFALSNLPLDYSYTLLLNNRPLLLASAGVVPPGSSTFALAGAAAGNYRVARLDLCGTNPDTSAAIHTLALTGTTRSGHNVLRFDYGPVRPLSFRIERTPLRPPAPVVLPDTATRFDDSLIVCGTTYRYRVTAVLAGGSESVNEVELLAQAGPVPVPQVTASFSLNNVVELNAFLPAPALGLPAGSRPRFRRSQGMPPVVVNVGTTRGAAVLRDTATLARLLLAPPCYTAVLTDTCTITSLAGPPTCPALLRAALADANGYTVQLDWSAFQGPDPNQPRQDTLLSITADGTVLSKVPVTGLPDYPDSNTPADRQTLRYRLKSTGAGLPPGAVSYSNVAVVTRQSSLVIPTAFTPNGDGLNDVLELKGRFLTNFTFIIVDRNGREAFRSTDRNQSWDGRISGSPPANGAYVWRFHQTDETGKTRNLVGTVTILQ